MAASGMYNLTASDGTTAQFGLGDEVDVAGARYKYFKSSAAIGIYAVCSVSNVNVAVEGTTTTSGAKPTLFCIPQFAVAAADEFFWAPIGPFDKKVDDSAFYVNAALNCATSTKLYTTATAGVVDDAATDLIAGLTLTETITTARAATCISVARLVSNCQD